MQAVVRPVFSTLRPIPLSHLDVLSVGLNRRGAPLAAKIRLYKLTNARQARKWPIGVVSSACVVGAVPDVRARFRAEVA
jgi:hypothetical protein